MFRFLFRFTSLIFWPDNKLLIVKSQFALYKIYYSSNFSCYIMTNDNVLKNSMAVDISIWYDFKNDFWRSKLSIFLYQILFEKNYILLLHSSFLLDSSYFFLDLLPIIFFVSRKKNTNIKFVFFTIKIFYGSFGSFLFQGFFSFFSAGHKIAESGTKSGTVYIL